MSTMLYRVASPSSETKFSGISFGAFWIKMSISQKKLSITGHEMTFPKKVNKRTSHYPKSLYFILTLKPTPKDLNQLVFFILKESRGRFDFDLKPVP
jgi:hypothetical protein